MKSQAQRGNAKIFTALRKPPLRLKTPVLLQWHILDRTKTLGCLLAATQVAFGRHLLEGLRRREETLGKLFDRKIALFRVAIVLVDLKSKLWVD